MQFFNVRKRLTLGAGRDLGGRKLLRWDANDISMDLE